MRPAAGGGEGWEVHELIGAYAAGELEGKQARLAERPIIERPGYYGRLSPTPGCWCC